MTSAEITALAAVVVSLFVGGGGIFAYLNERRKGRNERLKDAELTDEQRAARIGGLQLAELTRLYSRVSELETRMTVLVQRDTAFVNILNDAARQWPRDTPGPKFNQGDIDVLSQTLPSRWRVAAPQG
jgi:hypothetical protein